MPRYIVERSFPDGLLTPQEAHRADPYHDEIARDADEGVTWIHSYVSSDATRTYCVVDGPNPEAIRRAAARNHLPVSRITQVSVLDPYFYRG
jgi:hypothetical protein